MFRSVVVVNKDKEVLVRHVSFQVLCTVNMSKESRKSDALLLKETVLPYMLR